MSLLRSIIDSKKREIASLPAVTPVRRTRASFIDAILKNRPGLIAEVKPQSPSEGNLIARDDIPALVELYDRRAQAISVLCDQEYFGGGFDLLSEVSKQTDLPMLAKEFILDARQIDHAAVNGASAVLLIAAILETHDLTRLTSHAIALGLDVLMEIHTQEDAEKTITAFRSFPETSRRQILMGINNRDLETLNIDLDATTKLAPLLRRALPELRGIITESGISNRGDIERLKPVVDGFLIGTSIIKAKNRGEFITNLMMSDGPLLKFCGMTRIEDIALAEGLNVNFIGFIFAAHSSRKITLAAAKLLRTAVTHAKVVGVFEKNSQKEILQYIDELQLDMVQIYGDVPGGISIPVIHAFRGIPAMSELESCDYVLIDKAEGENAADFDAIAALPTGIRSRLFLAGGITPQNVRALSDRIQPFAIDCARGIESQPGIKDPEKMNAFISVLTAGRRPALVSL
ncbi:MAG: hypothetical protein HOO67_02645 [Candidatus Peribacteraceae bacterium]|nr:hypothetical protein [Candidatus Peribacteraceae bacterium]